MPHPAISASISVTSRVSSSKEFTSFLAHPDGTWNAYVYDNNTGAATAMPGGVLLGIRMQQLL